MDIIFCVVGYTRPTPGQCIVISTFVTLIKMLDSVFAVWHTVQTNAGDG